jgi:hypothetical protein
MKYKIVYMTIIFKSYIHVETQDKLVCTIYVEEFYLFKPVFHIGFSSTNVHSKAAFNVMRVEKWGL